MITQEQIIRNLGVMNDGEIDFFLGAGASAQSGVPTGGDLVWNFKREIYCTENNMSNQLYQDLKLPSTQEKSIRIILKNVTILILRENVL